MYANNSNNNNVFAIALWIIFSICSLFRFCTIICVNPTYCTARQYPYKESKKLYNHGQRLNPAWRHWYRVVSFSIFYKLFALMARYQWFWPRPLLEGVKYCDIMYDDVNDIIEEFSRISKSEIVCKDWEWVQYVIAWTKKNLRRNACSFTEIADDSVLQVPWWQFELFWPTWSWFWNKE